MGYQEISSMSLEKRLTMLVYGRSRVGKTTRILEVAEKDLVWVLSTDNGLSAALRQPGKYTGRLFVSTDKKLSDVRATLIGFRRDIEARKETIPLQRMWVVIDTLTHLQTHFLNESRKVAVATKGVANPKVSDLYIRDATTQVDYGIVGSWITEVCEMVLAIPCNIVFICMEKYEDKIATPQLVGSSVEYVKGLCDVISRLVVSEDDSRVLICANNGGPQEVGFRGEPNLLEAVEPANFRHIRSKYLKGE